MSFIISLSLLKGYQTLNSMYDKPFAIFEYYH